MALCLPIRSERNLLKWLQENIEKLVILNKRGDPTRHAKTLFGFNVIKLVVGVNIFDVDLGFQVDSVEPTNQEQLCLFWTRVSPSDFYL